MLNLTVSAHLAAQTDRRLGAHSADLQRHFCGLLDPEAGQRAVLDLPATVERPPPDQLRSDSLSHADVYSGLHAAIAILACLSEHERTGWGQYIDVAMAAVMLSVNERVHVDLPDEYRGDEHRSSARPAGPSSKDRKARGSPAP